MRAVGPSLYHALRGGAAVIEGAEFLLTHRRILVHQAPHVLAAGAFALIATWLASRLIPVLPQPHPLSLPWYFVLIEWLWSRLPSVLAADIAAWSALTAYLALAWPRQLVWAVMAQRNVTRPSAPPGHERGPALFLLSAGGAGCGLAAYVPVVGPAAAAVLAWPVLGAGLVVATLTLRGWPRADIYVFVRTRWEILGGLGLGVAVSVAIPVVNLVALPCAVAGTACLLFREPRPGVLRTSEGTIPCASPDK